MLIIEAVLILLYFVAQILENAAEKTSLVDRYSILLFVISMVALSLVAVFAAKKWPILKSNNKIALVIGHLILYGIIFISYGEFVSIYFYTNMLMSASIFVFVIAVAGAFLIPTVIKAPFMQKYFQKKFLIILGIISAYASFAAIGNMLLISTEISLVSIVVYLLGILWVFPILLQFIYLYEAISIKFKAVHCDTQINEKKTWLKLFGIFSGIWIVFLISCYPANMAADSFGMWREATSGERIGYLGFPSIIIIFVRLLTYIIPHPFFVALIQIVLMSWLCSSFLLKLCKRGVPEKFAYIFAFVWAALPSNGLMMATLYSNVPYTMSLLFFTVIILEIIDSEKISIWLVCKVIIVLPLTFSLRLTGPVPFIFGVIFLLFFAFKRTVKPRLLFAITVGCVFAVLIQGPLYDAVTIRPTVTRSEQVDGQFFPILLIEGIRSVVYYGGTLPRETQEYLETFAPLEDWGKTYNRYSFNTSAYPDSFQAVSSTQSKTLMRHYMITFIHEPVLLILDRVTKSHMVWDISSQTDFSRLFISPAHNEWFDNAVVEEGFEFQRRENIFTKLITEIYYPLSFRIPLFDVILYKSGLYIILSMLLCLFMAANNMKKYMAAFLPMLGDITALLISMGWPAFRHVWFVFVVFTFICPYVLSNKLER